MTEKIIGQIFSIIGMALTVVSFQMKTKKTNSYGANVGLGFFSSQLSFVWKFCGGLFERGIYG